MKCESVASLWSPYPPSHHVTAAATLPEPPSLYTGASDGSIAWWKLHGDLTPAPRPLALLCGHSAPISALSPCSPVSSPALLSACSDAVLCVWSATTGHCRRRRKFPPWAGSPSAAASLPRSPRYVCVACANADGDPDNHPRRGAARVAVLVVDSCALSVVQTVAHGSSPLGRLRFARVAAGAERDAVVLADDRGNVEVLGIQKDSEALGGTGIRWSVSAVPTGETSKAAGGEDAVWLDVCGMLMAVVFGNRCLFRAVASGSIVGEILLKDTLFWIEDHAVDMRLVGGMFLQDEGSRGGNVLVRFTLWTSEGAAVVYVVGGGAVDDSEGELFLQPICGIPAHSSKAGSQDLVIFCEFGSCLLRIRSCCCLVGGLSRWRPFVTIWSMTDLLVSYPESSGREEGVAASTMIGEGCFPVSWNEHDLSSAKQLVGSLMESTAFNCEDASVKPEKCDGEIVMCRHVVMSSMVLSENSFAPYAIVYGFDNGDIEVTRFWNSFLDVDCIGERMHSSSNIIKQSFLGHTGGVVCLAAHRMVAKSSEHNLSYTLVSGSLDCTVRVWDMNKGNVVAVLHHHVAPVRQIILPPPSTVRPWNDCFLSVAEDGCVALVSLETLRVERMFPGHPSYPSKVVWDGARGYVACLCKNIASHPDAAATLCIWDVKTGARERVLRGAASHAMFDHFCGRIDVNELTGNMLGGTTSASLLHLPVVEDASPSSSNMETLTKGKEKYVASGDDQRNVDLTNVNHPPVHRTKENLFMTENGPPKRPLLQPSDKIKMPAVGCSGPLPGIAVLKFDLASIMSPLDRYESPITGWDKEAATNKVDHGGRKLDKDLPEISNDTYDVQGAKAALTKESVEGDLIRLSLAFLHLWDIDSNLDALLMDEMNIFKPDGLSVASGIPGDKGSLMMTFPGLDSTLELWKSSSEFSAMRSLTIVSLAQRLITLSHASSTASSALAAFYTRNFAEKIPSIKPPLLQILVSFWQDSSEHVRMAARSLFHCAAPRAVPSLIHSDKIIRPGSPSIPVHIGQDYSQLDETCLFGDDSFNSEDGDLSSESDIIAWLESYEMYDWISCIGGTPQDAMASHIIVAAALAVWYPTMVKTKLAKLIVHHLIKLVMVVNEFYSSTAAELLSEGMESLWKSWIGSEIPRLIGDIFFQIECLSGSAAGYSNQTPLAIGVREALVGILLPSLAMADIPGFLHVIESQIWATASDSPVHLVSLKTLIRVIRGSPKPLIPYLDKVANFILQTLDPANPAIRKVCFQCSTAALKELSRAFPVVALDAPFLRLAVGDAFGDVNHATIKIYDLRSLAKIKVLDASGPPGLPIFSGAADATLTSAISVLSFSPDGEGLVAFSEQGLVIRWWSLGSAWWEKLSRNTVPTQCTKLIFVPPWEGFSPSSSRSSIIASIVSQDCQMSLQEKKNESNDDGMKILLHNLDLSYRLEWIAQRKVVLTRFGRELGSVQF